MTHPANGPSREGRCPTTDVNFFGDPVRCTLPAGHDEPCGGGRGGKWATDECSVSTEQRTTLGATA